MSVFITKSMLSNMTLTKCPSYSRFTETSTPIEEHWKKLMDESNKTDLAKALLCRICGRDGYTPLSETYYGYSIYLLIRSVTNVSVDVNDSLPKFICTACLENLKVAVNFKYQCEASDRKYKKILNPSGDPAMHSYPYSKHDFQLILHDMKARRMEMEEKREREKREYYEKLSQQKEKNKYKCKLCDMSFPTRSLMTKHRREGKCQRRACEICGQLVISIKHHMRVAHKQKHKCKMCGREFSISARLKNHMLVHTNTFNFFCDLCPYKCKHKYYLVMHMRTHTGEKPYKCPMCEATFVNPSNLNKHKLIHQEKQFKCSMCDKAFRTGVALREHYEAAHMNIKHTCQYCARVFCYKSDLRKHEIRSHHRTKRDYIGGEPTYKQVERMQRVQEWRPPEIIVSQPAQIVQQNYVEVDSVKYAAHGTQTLYFSDMNGMLHQQPIQHQHLVQEQSVEIILPELAMKKDDVKLTYEEQGIGYF